MSRPSKLRRAIEREMVDGLRAGRRRVLVERLRGNESERRGWDRAIAALRVLEDRAVSRTEIDQVERWLFDDLATQGVVEAAPAGRGRGWTWLGATLATVATAATLLIWIGGGEGDPQPAITTGDTGELIGRGGLGIARPLGLELVCGTPPRPARDHGCALDELLGFSVRLGDEALDPRAAAALAEAPLHLSVFGIAETGEVRYYLPNPGASELPELAMTKGWTALPTSVRLAVNHGPGRVRVFALASALEPSTADIDRLAASLAEQARASVDDPPWHLRLEADELAPLCSDVDRCASAESEFLLLNPDPARDPARTRP
ncbi:hypothetical protein DB30_00237 [Enhygromyxa salina]|uniref:Uncharacterized protein n=1 Tax=Enhygromyxa salina TaxID=215803 RepID=A0A0C2DFW6_9BACT|nr:hypothetical protein [Enhygromyxa salina]KIG18552.1 hypothetical protein DB30_00237 [Enhygromyxa salina]